MGNLWKNYFPENELQKAMAETLRRGQNPFQGQPAPGMTPNPQGLQVPPMQAQTAQMPNAPMKAVDQAAILRAKRAPAPGMEQLMGARTPTGLGAIAKGLVAGGLGHMGKKRNASDAEALKAAIMGERNQEEEIRQAQLEREEQDRATEEVRYQGEQARQGAIDESNIGLNDARVADLEKADELNAAETYVKVSPEGATRITVRPSADGSADMIDVTTGKKADLTGAIPEDAYGDLMSAVGGDSDAVEAYLKALNKGAGEAAVDLGKQADSARQNINRLKLFTEMAPGAREGGAQPLLNAVGNFFSTFGYESEYLENEATMEAAISGILGDYMRDLGARGLTDKDMDILKMSLPKVGTSDEARVSVANVMAKYYKGTIRKYVSDRLAQEDQYGAGKLPPRPPWFEAEEKRLNAYEELRRRGKID